MPQLSRLMRKWRRNDWPLRLTLCPSMLTSCADCVPTESEVDDSNEKRPGGAKGKTNCRKLRFQLWRRFLVPRTGFLLKLGPNAFRFCKVASGLGTSRGHAPNGF